MGINHLPVLLLLLGVGLLVFGPKRLPELGRGLGSAIKEFRKVGHELTADAISGSASAPEATPRPTVVPADTVRGS